MNRIYSRFYRDGARVATSEMVTRSDSQSQATEADSDGECETSEVPVKTLTWSDAGSSDHDGSPINFCSLNMSIFYTYRQPVLRVSLVVSLVISILNQTLLLCGRNSRKGA